MKIMTLFAKYCYLEIFVYSLFLSLITCSSVSGKEFHESSGLIRDFSDDFKQCVRQAQGFHLVLVSCSWQETVFQEKMIEFYQKKISKKLEGTAFKKFSHNQSKLNDNISDYCDQNPNFDLFRSDREGGGLEVEACFVTEYAKAASSLRRYYNRLLTSPR
jgi:hypothetical protein